jgi:xylan 1,4-beta-xylosidase
MKCRFNAALIVFVLLVGNHSHARADEAAVRVTVDCATTLGPLRPINGVNGGPLECGGLIDLSAQFRAAKFPYVRLHDIHWPNPDVVDMHVVFPNPEADPARPESYDFAATDDFVKAIDAAGGKVIYRLGESIEHTKRKLHVNPPKDVDRWAAAAVGIVRHYEEGFANSPKLKIPYWEIWNEPENRPACWTGTDEDFYKLYAATARAIKAKFPNAKVGGPGAGEAGKLMRDGTIVPSVFFGGFLDRCQQEKLPLDFLSWHCYTNDPTEPATRARAIRKLLDAHGFEKTESHLNEWNYLPDKNWFPIMLRGQGESRKKCYERMHGAVGAAFVAAAMIEMADAPVDVANYYTANTGGFGMFDESGVPKKSYQAMAAFGQLQGKRVAASVEGMPGMRSIAVSDGAGRVSVLIAVPSGAPKGQLKVSIAMRELPWKGGSTCVANVLDDARNLQIVTKSTVLEGEEISVDLGAPSVALVVLSDPQNRK